MKKNKLMKKVMTLCASTLLIATISVGQIVSSAYYDKTDSFYWTDTSTKSYNIQNNNSKKIGVQKLTSSSGKNIDETMTAAKAYVKNYQYNSSTKKYDKYGWKNSSECYARAKVIKKYVFASDKTLADTKRVYGKYSSTANTAKINPNVYGSAYSYCGYSGN